jgi:DNA-directed RNA polymerase subunit K/omega
MPPKKNTTLAAKAPTKVSAKTATKVLAKAPTKVPAKTVSKTTTKTGGKTKPKDDPDAVSDDVNSESDSDADTEDEINSESEVEEEGEVALNTKTKPNIDTVKDGDEESDDNLDDEKEDEEEEEEEVEEVEEVETEEVSKEDDGDCLYKFTSKKKKAKNILDEFEIEDDFAEDEDKSYNTSIYVPNDKRITKKYMTIYERVRLLGERATQLSYGAKPMIKNVGNLDPKIIAKLELEAKLIPLIIIRTLPNGLKEKWRVSELEIIN